ncbi:amino acid adenylation domain-containing protein [Streptomyces longwoodensis]|uniref:amino acid adenylation domain-containing protein n=1 Tax=Streptomyces longwoodensis TaxID=68231 RepID=UPI002DD86999|nr:amino acid adenylation domain-containing protein [Streptomyces longwoodensis]WRY92737.1 amino acid adenylation domain-containing protein [Streptomyces longwoodensis]
MHRTQRVAILDGDSRVLQPTTLPELYESQARATPDRIAVIFDGRKVDYAELNAQANQLAHLLIGQGVGPEDRVAVMIPRSVELVVALLAVLKAGAAYVPVDPGYPEERINLLLDDAAPRLVLAMRNTAPLVRGRRRCTVLDDGLTVARLGKQQKASPSNSDRAVPLLPDHPAYVIYTSGSTGRPKGVVIPHGGIVNRLLWMQAEYQLLPDDRVLQKTPASFDVSVWEFFWPLITGATMVVARPEGHKDPSYLVQLIRNESVTTVHFVPSMLRAFLQQPGASDCSGLRRIISSGEALPGDLVNLCLDTLDADLHNLYGPTEASVDVTYWQCTRDAQSSSVPIGRPVWNTRAYVLNDSLQAVAPGVVGELYLSGAQLACGYLGQPTLTAERFVPDVYGSAGTRMYRTGDLASVDEREGYLRFHGRIDHQLKVRGFRLEPAEIEGVLTQYPGTGQAVVVLREDLPGTPRLIAYVTPNPGAYLDGAAMRQFLTQRLPEHMVPAQVVVLERLPLTPNGKLDRQALPAPHAAGRTGQPPRTPLERTLCALTAEVLGLDAVGVEDDFFALGGYSLLAVSHADRIGKVLGFPVRIEMIYEAPTVAELARRLEQRPAAAEGA